MAVDPLLGFGLACIFAALVVALVTVVVPARPGRGVARSLAAIDALQGPPASLRDQELLAPFADRVLDPVLRRFVALGRRWTPDERLQRIRRRLDLAGNPIGWDVDRVLGVKALGAIVGFLVGLVLPAVAGFPWTLALLTVIALTVLGWFGPSLWLYQVAYNRSELIRRELPDALDLLTISVESGLAFDAAVSQVARQTTGPLAEEFFRVLQEMQIGTGRMSALRALADRTDVPELGSFVGAMIQADSFGIPVSGVLRIQSRELRVKRSQLAEEQAQKVPVKILFPLIFCILPSLFIVILGPAAIQMVETLSRGL